MASTLIGNTKAKGAKCVFPDGMFANVVRSSGGRKDTSRQGVDVAPRTSPQQSRKSSIIGGKTPAARGWGSYHSEFDLAVIRTPLWRDVTFLPPGAAYHCGKEPQAGGRSHHAKEWRGRAQRQKGTPGEGGADHAGACLL